MENTKEQLIERILNKAVEEIIPSKEDLRKLLQSGKKLKLYQGFDPTAPTLHIGHSVTMRKLEDFRKLGHEVYMLIGDFTGRIGDPSDKVTSRASARVALTEEQVKENLKLYVKQAGSFLNMSPDAKDIDGNVNPIKVVFNNDWLGKLKFADIVQLAQQFSVQQMLKRDMFQKRLEMDKPIYISEFMYPLMQGFDSVHLEVDVELGGNDQLFNMLIGRDMVRNMLKKEKFVIAGKLLESNDGVKMGKSEGNMIMLSDSPEDIFGKVMAFSDNQIISGFELLTDYEMIDVDEVRQQLKEGINPMEFKKKLAFEVTKGISGEENATKAQKHFEDVFQKKDFNTELEEVKVSKESLSVVDALVESKICPSKGQARRLVEQGAVYVNEKKVENWQEVINAKNVVLKAGKKVVKLTI